MQCEEASNAGLSVRCTIGVWPEQAERIGHSAPDAGGLSFERPVAVRFSEQVYEDF